MNDIVIYAAGEIHSQWRDELEAKRADLGVNAELVGAQTTVTVESLEWEVICRTLDEVTRFTPGGPLHDDGCDETRRPDPKQRH